MGGDSPARQRRRRPDGVTPTEVGDDRRVGTMDLALTDAMIQDARTEG
jgi:hypothetical protein